MVTYALRYVNVGSINVPVILMHDPGVMHVVVQGHVPYGKDGEIVVESAHLLEHMTLTGTKKWPTKQLLTDSIMDIGGDRNGYTKGHETEYFARVPDKEVAQAIDYVTDVLWSPLFPESQLQKEKDAIHVELGRRLRDDRYLLGMIARQALFEPDSFGYRDDIASRLKSLDSISMDQLTSLHKKAYAPANCVIAIGGNFDEKQVLDLITRAVREKGWELSGAAPIKKRKKTKSEHVSLKQPVKSEWLELMFPAPNYDDPDYFAVIAMRYILGGKPTARIPHLLRQTHQLSYTSRTFYVAVGNKGQFVVRTDARQGSLANAEQIILDELQSFRENGPTEKEVKKAIVALTGLICIVQRTDHKIAELATDFILTGSIRTPQDKIAGISKVTRDDVVRVARKIIPKEMKKENYASARIVNDAA